MSRTGITAGDTVRVTNRNSAFCGRYGLAVKIMSTGWGDVQVEFDDVEGSVVFDIIEVTPVDD